MRSTAGLFAITVLLLALAAGSAGASSGRGGKQPLAEFGQRLVCPGNECIYVIGPSGAIAMRIKVPGDWIACAWSPDFPQIAFVRGGQIWTCDLNTGAQVRRTNLSTWSASVVGQSRGGRFIAFIAGKTGIPYGPEALFLLDTLSGRLRVVTRRIPIWSLQDELFPDDISFLPGSDKLILGSEGEDAGAGRLDRVSVCTARREGLYGYGVDRTYYSLGLPSVSPNGRQIAAFSDSWNRLLPNGDFDMDVSGAGLVVLDVSGKRARHIRYGEEANYSWPIVWSVDGRSVVYCVGSCLMATDVATGRTWTIWSPSSNK
jgi:hypothetical protein